MSLVHYNTLPEKLYIIPMTSTVILGHSFVARLESASGSRNDMHAGLDLITCKVKFISKRGGHVKSMRPLLHHVSPEKLQIIFFHIGENDISVDLQNGVHVARDIIFLAQELVTQSFCKRLYVGELRFRFKGRYIHSHHQQMLFNDQVHAANAELKRHFHGNNQITWWSCKGIKFSQQVVVYISIMVWVFLNTVKQFGGSCPWT